MLAAASTTSRQEDFYKNPSSWLVPYRAHLRRRLRLDPHGARLHDLAVQGVNYERLKQLLLADKQRL